MAVQDEIPRSRITLKYKTEVDGELAPTTLPLRLLVLGDFSHGHSKDRAVDFEERRLRTFDGTNTAGVMKDMDINLPLTVPNKIDPENADNLEVTLPLRSMRSFSPDELSKNITKVRSLLLLKTLLLEAEANYANTKQFRDLVNALYADPAAFEKVQGELKGLEGLKVPATAGSAAGGSDAQ